MTDRLGALLTVYLATMILLKGKALRSASIEQPPQDEGGAAYWS